MLLYLLKASLVLFILFGFYKLFLEKETFYTPNRIYLLGSLILIFALPQIALPELIADQGILETSLKQVAPTLVSGEQFSLPSASIQAEQSITTSTSNGKKGITFWLMVIYLFGVLIFSLRLLGQLAAIGWKILKNTDQIKDTYYTIVNSSEVKEPCSFFHYIFINPESYDYDTYEQILKHEQIHVKKRHSFDLLLAELSIIILWFNPMIWLFRQAIENNLEFQTDDLMTKGTQEAKEGYQMNLLRIATLKHPLTITTNYNQSLIKQRILKMNTKKSNPHSYWKYTFILPIVSFMLLSFNKPIAGLIGPDLDDWTINISNSTNGNDAVVSTETVPDYQVAAIEGTCQDLLKAVKRQQVEKVKGLLQTVAPDCTFRNDGEPRSPLVAAARKGHLEIAQLLVEAGASLSYHARGDENPLMAAARYGHLSVAEYFIQKGADVNVQVKGDGTPLICAVRGDHYKVAKLLLEHGADPYQTSPGDEYAMYHARMSNNEKMVDLIEEFEDNK